MEAGRSPYADTAGETYILAPSLGYEQTSPHTYSPIPKPLCPHAPILGLSHELMALALRWVAWLDHGEASGCA